jgi:hypothetical protein
MFIYEALENFDYGFNWPNTQNKKFEKERKFCLFSVLFWRGEIRRMRAMQEKTDDS